jgi:hypothetical protein
LACHLRWAIYFVKSVGETLQPPICSEHVLIIRREKMTEIRTFLHDGQSFAVARILESETYEYWLVMDGRRIGRPATVAAEVRSDAVQAGADFDAQIADEMEATVRRTDVEVLRSRPTPAR